MKSNELRPGDVIRLRPGQCQVVKIEPINGWLLVRDFLGEEKMVAAEFLEAWWEKVDHG